MIFAVLAAVYSATIRRVTILIWKPMSASVLIAPATGVMTQENQ